MELDTVVVGAGAAGIGAGLALQKAARRFVILEARDRVGGRAWTESTSLGFPIDHGGQFLHSGDINPLVTVARTAGFHVPETPEDWTASSNAAPLLDDTGIRQLAHASKAFFGKLGRIDLDRPDQPVAALLPRSRWRPLLHAVMTFISGATPARASSADLAADSNTDIDLPIREGLGALVAHLARGLPVHTATPVTEIDWSRAGVRVTSTTGTLRCKHVLVTVPTNVLASGAIAFTPALPAAKQTAIAQLPQGVNEKVFVPLSGALIDGENVNAYSSVSSEDACHLQIQPFGRPCVMGYFGAEAAQEIVRLGDAGASDLLRSRLADVYGSASAKRVGNGIVTQWAQDPYALGAYSYALPGERAARDVLAEPLADRLYFAGEATYPAHYATVHGAFMSGQACVATLPAP